MSQFTKKDVSGSISQGENSATNQEILPTNDSVSLLSSSNVVPEAEEDHDDQGPDTNGVEVLVSGNCKQTKSNGGVNDLGGSQDSQTSKFSGSENRYVSDSVIRRSNSKILDKKGESAAQKIWGICKRLGALYSGGMIRW